MDTFLMVPLRLDALLVEKEKRGTEAMVDFVRLPYVNAQRDVNFNTANISEEILSQPFQNQNFDMKAGIHLHWAMPDALSHGENVKDPQSGDIKTVFAAVPNRWLITRNRRAKNGIKTTEAEWIVESDYLYPDGEGFQSGSISYPVTPNPDNNDYRPFRFMGRKMPLKLWLPKDPQAEYLDHLTTVGYGQPSFAAFYPNCHSVFGFCDPEIFPLENGKPVTNDKAKLLANLKGLSYDILGWYSDDKNDYYRQVAEKIQKRLKAQNDANNQSAEEYRQAFQEALKEEMRWVVNTSEEKSIPSRMLCYSRIDFYPGRDIENPLRAGSAAVAVGNTGGEALAAMLSREMDQNNAAQIEEQLLALQFSERLDHLQLDMGPKFQEARHEKGFQAVSGGVIWTIRPETAQAAKANALSAHQQSQISLPESMAHQLNTINLLQKAYEEALIELSSLRKQLFSDWYKYMLCAYPPEGSRDDYPDPDRVKFFIEHADLGPLQRMMARTGDLVLQREPGGTAIIAAAAPGASPAAIASQLASAIQRLLSQLQPHNDRKTVKDSNVLFKLKANAAPRFWQPREPVVLLKGDAVRATERHGNTQDGGYLEIQPLSVAKKSTVQDYILQNLTALRGTVEGLASQVADGEIKGFGFQTWHQQPWHPFLLSWEVDVRPLQNKSNMDPSRGMPVSPGSGGPGSDQADGYADDFISGNYDLPETAVDLQLKGGTGETLKRDKAALKDNIYQGTTVLTPQAGYTLKGKIKAYLKKRIQKSGALKALYPGQKIDDTFLESNFTEVLQKFEQSENAPKADSAQSRYIQTYRQLQNRNFHVLSQSLGGFNEALLMHKQTLQLPVEEPLAFPEYRDFTEAVGKALGKNITSAPVPESEFNPIRNGEMELLRLQLIDTFGQLRDVLHVENNIASSALFVSEQLRLPPVGNENPRITLPPRLAQPARVAFRWLSADLGEVEMNEHPATTPVCGWLLSNHLDNSLVVYSNAGKALGAIDQLGRWQTTPGADQPIYPSDITNTYLRKLVYYLLERDTEFQQAFISSIDSALRTIEPANFAQHQARALLMGRPVAVVRASVGLELQGLPAIHQAWSTLNGDMNSDRRHSDFFEAVKLPIRIGEYQQFNDGLVGYWVEEKNGYRERTFFSPQSEEAAHPLIRTHSTEPLNLYKALQDSPDTLLMLVDPRGVVHATSGMLPTKSIELPPDQINQALGQIEITFLSTPVLSDSHKLHLPLPKEAGYRWSWLERRDDHWQAIGTVGVLKRQAIGKAFPNGADIYAALVSKGWLKTIDEESATIVPRDQRPSGNPGKEITAVAGALEDIFDRAHITGTSDRAKFYGAQALREGWLKLSPDDTSNETKDKG